MIYQYVQKVRIIFNTHQSPYLLEKFYTFWKSISIQIEKQQINHQLLNNYSLIYDYLLECFENKIELLQHNNIQQLRKELYQLLIPLQKYKPNTQLSQIFYQHFYNSQEDQFIYKIKRHTNKLIENYEQQNNKSKLHATHQLARIFWVEKFKTAYVVHFEQLWNQLLEIIQKLPYFNKFISQSSKHKIKGIVDPQNKYYVTSSNLNDLFIQLSQPQLLSILAQLTSNKYKSPIFQSQSNLSLIFHKKNNSLISQCALKDGETILLNGENIMIGSQRKPCQYAGAIRFGSSEDADVRIKSQYVSRRQFLIIEEQQSYFLVCLSPSNYTTITYPFKIKMYPGIIFKVGQETIQVIDIYPQNIMFTAITHSEQQYYEHTLEQLPEESSQFIHQTLEYMYLSGPKKNEKEHLDWNNKCIFLHEQLNENNQTEINIIYEDGQFYLSNGTQILIKTANQVLQGRLSHKVKIHQNMKINLQGCEFTVQ